MLKQITVTVIECDVCGATEKLEELTKHNENERLETYYDLPSGWVHSDVNYNFCICPKCWKKLSKE